MRTRLRRLQPLLVCVLALGLVLLVGGVMESLHAQAPTVVRYWLWLDDPTEPMFDQLVKEFNAIHPTIRVEYQLDTRDRNDRKLRRFLGGSCSGVASVLSQNGLHRVRCLPASIRGQVPIHVGGDGNRGMPELPADRQQRDAPLEGQAGVGMPKRVHPESAPDPGSLESPRQGIPDERLVHRFACSAWEQPAGFLPPDSRFGPDHFNPSPQDRDGRRSHVHGPGLPALRAAYLSLADSPPDVELVSDQVHVPHLQPDRFALTQSGGGDGQEQGMVPGLPLCGHGEQAGQFRLGQPLHLPDFSIFSPQSPSDGFYWIPRQDPGRHGPPEDADQHGPDVPQVLMREPLGSNPRLTLPPEIGPVVK